jgi:hypothetical protein
MRGVSLKIFSMLSVLLVKHYRELHQQGENYGEWFQRNDRGLYSITIYITFDYLQQ